MLEPVRAIRLMGGLVLFNGAVFLLFWKTVALAIAAGMSRYENFTGRLAQKFFSQDKALIGLLQTGDALAPWLFFIGVFISCVGVLFIAFPKQAMQILCAFRILRREP